ncbi:hypothetical protein AYO44_15820 [Planctomycetaceae bacterium SCGC AG-212-F19]|nr:hypothetical protein AYO44_15820 [Planctomycetaceae bacterium SCGC AG-212-F19]
MRHIWPVIVAGLAILVSGCSRTNQEEIAVLRAELEAAKQQVAELKAQIGQHGNANNQNGQPVQPVTQKMRLRITRGLKPNWEYLIHEGRTVIGRADEMPVDIDLQPQEPDERTYSSKQHAAITCTKDALVIEDLNSANGTYVNRKRVPPGEKCALKKDDIIQIAEIQIKVLW